MFVFAIIAVLLVIAGTAWFFYFVYTAFPAQPELKATATGGIMCSPPVAFSAFFPNLPE